MKRLSIYSLAFLTFWMSTWMVTDIHDWSMTDTDHPHSVFSEQQLHSHSDNLTASQDHNPHCGVCSYDHGGHIGQSLAAVSFIAESIPLQNAINSPLPSDFWYSRSPSPNFRPPIV